MLDPGGYPALSEPTQLKHVLQKTLPEAPPPDYPSGKGERGCLFLRATRTSTQRVFGLHETSQWQFLRDELQVGTYFEIARQRYTWWGKGHEPTLLSSSKMFLERVPGASLNITVCFRCHEECRMWTVRRTPIPQTTWPAPLDPLLFVIS